MPGLPHLSAAYQKIFLTKNKEGPQRVNCYALQAIVPFLVALSAGFQNFLWQESDSPSCVANADRKTIFFTCRRRLRDIPQFGGIGRNVRACAGVDCSRASGLENIIPFGSARPASPQLE